MRPLGLAVLILLLPAAQAAIEFSSAVGCEASLSRPFIRLVDYALARRVITIAQLEQLAGADAPVNPLATRALEPRAMELSHALQREMQKISDWPAERELLRELLVTLKTQDSQTSETRKNTRTVFGLTPVAVNLGQARFDTMAHISAVDLGGNAAALLWADIDRAQLHSYVDGQYRVQALPKGPRQQAQPWHKQIFAFPIRDGKRTFAYPSTSLRKAFYNFFDLEPGSLDVVQDSLKSFEYAKGSQSSESHFPLVQDRVNANLMFSAVNSLHLLADRKPYRRAHEYIENVRGKFLGSRSGMNLVRPLPGPDGQSWIMTVGLTCLRFADIVGQGNVISRCLPDGWDIASTQFSAAAIGKNGEAFIAVIAKPAGSDPTKTLFLFTDTDKPPIQIPVDGELGIFRPQIFVAQDGRVFIAYKNASEKVHVYVYDNGILRHLISALPSWAATFNDSVSFTEAENGHVLMIAFGEGKRLVRLFEPDIGDSPLASYSTSGEIGFGVPVWLRSANGLQFAFLANDERQLHILQVTSE